MAQAKSSSGAEQGKKKQNGSAKKRLRKLRAKKFTCPIHGEFNGVKWGPHRRWCRAGAKGNKRKKPAKRKAKKRTAKKKGSVVGRKKIKRPVETLELGVHRSELILHNGTQERLIVKIVHGGDFSKVADRVTKLIKMGFEIE